MISPELLHHQELEAQVQVEPNPFEVRSYKWTPDSFHRQDSEINSNHGSQETRVEQQQRQQPSTPLEDPNSEPTRQRRPDATGKTVRAVDENGESPSVSRPRTSNTLPSLQLREIGELNLTPPPIARHDGGADSDISRQIRRNRSR